MTHTESTPTDLDDLRGAWAIAVAKFGPNSGTARDLETAIASAEADEQANDPSTSPTWCEMCYEDHADESEYDAARARNAAERDEGPVEQFETMRERVSSRVQREQFERPAPRPSLHDQLAGRVLRGPELRAPDVEVLDVTPTPFDERALDDADAIIDMTGMAVTSTAAVLAIRAAVQYRADQAQARYLAAQHGSYAVGRGRAMVARDTWREALALVDTVIAERLN